MMYFNVTVFLFLIIITSFTFAKIYNRLKINVNFVYKENKFHLLLFYLMHLLTILTQMSNGFIMPWWFYAPSDS